MFLFAFAIYCCSSLSRAAVLKLDTTDPEFSWDDSWEFVSQTGVETGNNELQNYVPEQIQIGDNNSLHLKLTRSSYGGGGGYLSGKIKSKWTLLGLAPERGLLEVQFYLPVSAFSLRSMRCTLAPGLWPALWIVPPSRNAAWPTGGEIDLLEMMHKKNHPESAMSGFATLHFGPRRGIDAVFDGQWGLRMGYVPMKCGQKHTISFRWERLNSKRWLMRQSLDDDIIWEQITDHVGAFKDFEKGKNFMNADAYDFSKHGEGNPARVFQRAFDEFPLHVILNVGFGGSPFGYDKHVDRNLREAMWHILSVKVWEL